VTPPQPSLGYVRHRDCPYRTLVTLVDPHGRIQRAGANRGAGW
jgi:hypothetical protein